MPTARQYELGSFSIDKNLNKQWVLSHHEISEIPNLFHRGIRIFKNVMIAISEGSIFPIELLVDSCTEQEVIPFEFRGIVRQNGQTFHFFAVSEATGAPVHITFSTEPL